jgi:hypothetical protein
MRQTLAAGFVRGRDVHLRSRTRGCALLMRDDVPNRSWRSRAEAC